MYCSVVSFWGAGLFIGSLLGSLHLQYVHNLESFMSSLTTFCLSVPYIDSFLPSSFFRWAEVAWRFGGRGRGLMYCNESHVLEF